MGCDNEETIAGLLVRIRGGDEEAGEALFGLLYDELRNRAGALMRGQPVAHTLQATALLNEAYLRVFRHDPPDWNDRSHFLAVATRAMKTVLIDHARSKGRAKRGGDRVRVGLQGLAVRTNGGSVELLDLTDALARLAEFDERAAHIVDLRFFGGLTNEEAARVAGISRRAAERDWAAARAWLREALL